MHARKFGSKKIVRTRTYVRAPLHVSRGEILHFRYPCVSAVNADSFFRLNSNVFIDVDNRERARARDKKQRRPILLVE